MNFTLMSILKFYKFNLGVSSIISLFIGALLYFLKANQIGFILSMALSPIIFTSIYILYLERLFAPLLSVLLILISFLFYASSHYFSKSITALYNFDKSSAPAHQYFIIILTLITFFTIIASIYTTIVKHYIDNKKALTGRQGKIGPRGEIGKKGDNNHSTEDIIIQQLKPYAESIFKLALKQQTPNTFVDENKTYLKNMLFLDAIENAVHSYGFKSIKLKLRKQVLEKLNQETDEHKIIKQDMVYQSEITRKLLLLMQKEISQWMETIVQYENGIFFLQNATLHVKSWNTLYTFKDKERELPTSPFHMLNQYDSWLWSQLTEDEYRNLKYKLKITCDNDNSNCMATKSPMGI